MPQPLSKILNRKSPSLCNRFALPVYYVPLSLISYQIKLYVKYQKKKSHKRIRRLAPYATKKQDSHLLIFYDRMTGICLLILNDMTG